MEQFNLQIYSASKQGELHVPLETLIVFFVHNYLGNPNINFNLIKSNCENNRQTYVITLEDISYTIIDRSSACREINLCELPSVVCGKTIIAGLCAVIRQLIKTILRSNPEHYGGSLLGFKSGCLMAPNEVSVWTKFCEIDMRATVLDVKSSSNVNEIHVPVDLIRFENHMSQPVRIHNVYKFAREQKKVADDQNLSNTSAHFSQLNLENSKEVGIKLRKSKTLISSSTPIADLNLEHTFAEGPFMTLADIILFPQFYLIFRSIFTDALSHDIPLTVRWFELLQTNPHVFRALNIITHTSQISSDTEITYIKPQVKNESLYQTDPKRYKPQNRIFTKQIDVDHSLSIIATSPINILKPGRPFGRELTIDWSTIPADAGPLEGALPDKRAQRKCEQLENLAKAVLKLAHTGDVIVDFCSGSGHLGILLAVLLPGCEVLLLENKEISLNRAKQRVEKLRLTNVRFLQCNLDYFTGAFNVGVSLHACGVATDLVLQQCLDRRAAFVCCPCCYGAVHDCHHLSYPRSRLFQESALTIKDYLVLGHSADQTHDKENVKTVQGEFSMAIIDTDRVLYAKDFGYYVELGKLDPPSCTPKNNLLIGKPLQLET